MQNFQNELQGLEIDPFQVGELAPIHSQSQDPRHFGGMRCGGFRCGGFRCFGCGGCYSGYYNGYYNCYNCVSVVVI